MIGNDDVCPADVPSIENLSKPLLTADRLLTVRVDELSTVTAAGLNEHVAGEMPSHAKFTFPRRTGALPRVCVVTPYVTELVPLRIAVPGLGLV